MFVSKANCLSHNNLEHNAIAYWSNDAAHTGIFYAGNVSSDSLRPLVDMAGSLHCPRALMWPPAPPIMVPFFLVPRSGIWLYSVST